MASLQPNTPEDFSVFVGDLAADVNDNVLQETFGQFLPGVRSAKVITDPVTGRSKGYGFVRFANEAERDRALDLQGFHMSDRPIRVSLATARRNPGPAPPGGAQHPAELDPANTTLFVGGLSTSVTEDQLRAVFGSYGEVVYTKIPLGKGCGFVQYRDRPNAEHAMAELNGQVLGTSAIRISWGRSTSRAAAAAAAAAGARPPMPMAPGGGYHPGGYPDGYGAAAAGPAGYGSYGQPGAYGGAYGAAGPYGVNGAGGPAAAAGFQGYGAAASAAAMGAYGGQLAAQMGQVLQPGQGMPLVQQAPAVYDPAALTDLAQANALYLQHQQPQLLGSFFRLPPPQ